MKSLIRKNIYKYLGVKEPLGLRPDSTSVYSIQNASISDCFCWRTDKGYKTIFRFTDILELFYEINSNIEIIFYSKNNKFIKKIILDKNNLSNELIIDRTFMNNVESYGVFFIFHQSDNADIDEQIIVNKCYLGFSYNNNLPSFVHGNTLSKYKKINGSDMKSNLVETSVFLNETYRIQDDLSKNDLTELFFANPTSKKIYFKIQNKNYFLNAFESVILSLKFKEVNGLKIISNCLFLRPTLFKYRNKYLDVQHS